MTSFEKQIWSSTGSECQVDRYMLEKRNDEVVFRWKKNQNCGICFYEFWFIASFNDLQSFQGLLEYLELA